MDEVKSRYIFDLDKMMNFIFASEKNGHNVNSEIIETYDTDEVTNEFGLSSKVMREVKDSDFSSQDTIRYDLIKIFLQTLLTVEPSGANMTLGESVIINTMLNNGMIKEVAIEK